MEYPHNQQKNQFTVSIRRVIDHNDKIKDVNVDFFYVLIGHELNYFHSQFEDICNH